MSSSKAILTPTRAIEDDKSMEIDDIIEADDTAAIDIKDNIREDNNNEDIVEEVTEEEREEEEEEELTEEGNGIDSELLITENSTESNTEVVKDFQNDTIEADEEESKEESKAEESIDTEADADICGDNKIMIENKEECEINESETTIQNDSDKEEEFTTNSKIRAISIRGRKSIKDIKEKEDIQADNDISNKNEISIKDEKGLNELEVEMKAEEIDLKKELIEESLISIGATLNARTTRKSLAHPDVASTSTRITRNRQHSRPDTPPIQNNNATRPRRSITTRKLAESSPTICKRKRMADEPIEAIIVKQIKIEEKEDTEIGEEETVEMDIKQEITESDESMASNCAISSRSRARGRKSQTPTICGATGSPSTRTTRHTKLTTQSTSNSTSTSPSADSKRRRTATITYAVKRGGSLLKSKILQTTNDEEKQNVDELDIDEMEIETDTKSALQANGIGEPLSVDTAAVIDAENSVTGIIEDVETASTSGGSAHSSCGSEKAASLSPEMVSDSVNIMSVKQFYKKPKFLENNLGIEDDLKLGEIVQKVTSSNEETNQEEKLTELEPAGEMDEIKLCVNEEDDIEDETQLKSTKNVKVTKTLDILETESQTTLQANDDNGEDDVDDDGNEDDDDNGEEEDEEAELFCDRLVIQEEEIYDDDMEIKEEDHDHNDNMEPSEEDNNNEKTRNECDKNEAKLKEDKEEMRDEIKEEHDNDLSSMDDVDIKQLKLNPNNIKQEEKHKKEHNKENIESKQVQILDEESNQSSNNVIVKENESNLMNENNCKEESSPNKKSKLIKDEDISIDAEKLREKEQHLQTLGLLTHKAAEKRRLEFIQSSAAAVEAATAAAAVEAATQRCNKRNNNKTTAVTATVATTSTEYTGTLKTVIKLNRNAIGTTTAATSSGNNAGSARKGQTHTQAKENSGNGSNGNVRRQPLKMTFQKGRGRGQGNSDRSANAQSHEEDAYYTIQNENEGGPKNSKFTNSHAEHNTNVQTHGRKSYNRSNHHNSSTNNPSINSNTTTKGGVCSQILYICIFY